MELKIKYVIKSLVAIIVIQIVMIAWGAYQIFEVNRVSGDWVASPLSAWGLHGSLVMIFSGLSANYLNDEDKPYSWVLAVSACLMALASYAFPAAIIGLLYLSDKSVREHYFKKMNLQF